MFVDYVNNIVDTDYLNVTVLGKEIHYNSFTTHFKSILFFLMTTESVGRSMS